MKAEIHGPKAEIPQWMIWSWEHMAWWKPMSWGYTTEKAEAGLYTRAEAQRIVDNANITVTPGTTPNEIMVLFSGDSVPRMTSLDEAGEKEEAEIQGAETQGVDEGGKTGYPRWVWFPGLALAAVLIVFEVLRYGF